MIRLETSFCGVAVAIWRPKYKRHLEFVGGLVSKLCPVTIYYRRKRAALRERRRLRRYGYRVSIKREKRTSETVAGS